MKRSEAYHILGKMMNYATDEQQKALSIAMSDIEFIDLAKDGDFCPNCGAKMDGNGD